jgi:hypothetical protein
MEYIDQKARNFTRRVDRTIDWLVRQGYAIRISKGIRITPAGIAYLALQETGSLPEEQQKGVA